MSAVDSAIKYSFIGNLWEIGKISTPMHNLYSSINSLNYKAIKKLLNSGNCNMLEMVDERGFTVLHVAVLSNSYKIIEFLLRRVMI